MQVVTHRREGERGSALLIVFVFAAIIAIMLYREFPVTVFEAQRQKEQLLVDRGHEYVRAVQLFYRKNRGQYPASIEQLEGTNNIRYLRRRYKDPFTGKDDWRLLHAGPGGLLVDSKLKQQPIPGINGQPGAAGQAGSLGQSSSTSSFDSHGINSASSLADSSSSSSDATVVVAQVPQRPPAIPANTAIGSGAQTPSSETLAQNPDAPLLPPSSSDTAQGSGGFGGAGNRNSGSGNGAGSQGAGIMQTMSPVLGNATTPASQSGFGTGQSGSGSSFGQLGGGGALAGVASKAKGRTIKVVNDQDDYSLWEFYYNPATDPTGRLSLGGSLQAPVQVGAPGVALPNGTNPASTSNSTFTTTPDAGSSNAGGNTSNGGANAPVDLPPPPVPNQAPPE